MLGQLVAQTDTLGRTSVLTYDLLGRMTVNGAGELRASWLASYLYDQGDNGIGRRSRVTDTTGSAWWAYDTRGRVTDDNRRVQPANYTYLTRYGYDDANRVTTMWMPGGEVVANTYDAAGQPYS